MNNLIFILLALPITALLFIIPAKNEQEKYISLTAISATWLHFAMTLGLTGLWLYHGGNDILLHGADLYSTAHSHFSIDFFIDGTSLVYLLVSALLTGAIGIFSRFYMHREKGYKRFFTNFLFFFLGINVIVLSNNLETLFIGWEIIGVTSFFLIAFYRDRYLPVKNSLKVISLYRLADAAMLLGIWMAHHYFKQNINFSDLENTVKGHAHHYGLLYYLIPFVFLVAAMVKSAQFPFSSWLPRAMEGPTTSSAIFYGALSVHIGVFLLIRIFPLWENDTLFNIVLAFVGLLTSITASLTARVQSSVKTQIAYSSIAQIGIMFIEVALGWHTLALLHFAANAFLRSYQLLVSPSVLSYLIHDQFFNFNPPQHAYSDNWWGRMKMTIFVLSIREWNLDQLMYKWLWSPIKKLGNLIQLLGGQNVMIFFLPIYMAGLYGVYHRSGLPDGLMGILPEVFGVIGFILVTIAFTERKSAVIAWLLVVLNQLFTSVSIGLNEQFDYFQVHMFLSGIFFSAIIGLLVMYRLKKVEKELHLNHFQGYSYEHPRLAFVFVIACLGLAGFPITPTFIGEDLLLGHIHENQIFLTFISSLNFILDGLVVYRIYARIFMGPHERGYHEVAFRSS